MFNNLTTNVKRPNIIIIGTWDSKGEVLVELANLLDECGASCIRINVGVFETPAEYKIDIDTSVFVDSVDQKIISLRSKNRPAAVAAIKEGIICAIVKNKTIFNQSEKEFRIDGIIGVGGTNGTDLVTAFMREYPNIPAICLSTVAQHPNHHFTMHYGNIHLVNSITDIGKNSNSILRDIMLDAVGALIGRIAIRQRIKKQLQIKDRIAASQFGTTTPCVERCASLLILNGYEVCAFHMVGSGGKNMEALIRLGMFKALLEITPTELADLYGFGIFSAGPSRLSAAIEMKIPQVFVPGCLDMINLGKYEDVIKDPRFKDRILHKCNDEVTVMRPTLQELKLIAEHIVDKFRLAKSVIKILLPLKGISMFDHPDNKAFPWYDPDANKFLFDEIKRLVNLHCPQIEIIELNYHINDPEFADIATDYLMKAIEENKTFSHRLDEIKRIHNPTFFHGVNQRSECDNISKGEQNSETLRCRL